MSEHEGDVVFREGVHYPIADDVVELARPLRRNESNTGWRDAQDGEPLHNDTFHERDLEIDTGSGEVIELAADEADAVRAFLAERRGE